MKTPLAALAFVMSLSMVACSGTAPIDRVPEPAKSDAASPSASAAYDPKPATPTPGGFNEDGDYVGEEYSWGTMDDPKTAFPVTIDHAYGSTTIERQPKKFVTLGPGSDEVAIMMVRVPDAFPKKTLGANANDSYDWIDEALEGFQMPWGSPKAPKHLDTSKGIPVDEINAVKPDVILALQSGVSEEDYKKLSKIAPVVVHYAKPWQSDRREMILITGKALGQYNHAKQLVDELEEEYVAIEKAHPAFHDKRVIVADLPTDPSKPIGIYAERDVRTQSVAMLGFMPAEVTAKEANADGLIAWLAKDAAKAESDVVVAFAKDKAEADAIRANPTVQALPAAKAGNLVIIEDLSTLAVIQGPSPLALKPKLEEIAKAIETQAKLH